MIYHTWGEYANRYTTDVFSNIIEDLLLQSLIKQVQVYKISNNNCIEWVRVFLGKSMDPWKKLSIFINILTKLYWA